MNDLTHFRSPLMRTPFHARTSAANLLNRWGPWGGYMTALCFGDMDMEYTAIRNAASVYDLCPMVKYRITGPDAAGYLNRLTLRDVARLAVGAVQPFARRESLREIVPTFSRNLAAIAANGFALTAVIATAMIWNSRLILLEH